MSLLRSFIVFSGTGPLLILTSFPELTDPRLVERLGNKGITKFIGHEVNLDQVRASYGVPFDVVVADLDQVEDVRVLDFNGHHIFSRFKLDELGEAIKVEGAG